MGRCNAAATATQAAKNATATAQAKQSLAHDITLLDNRLIYHIRLTQRGQIRVSAKWTGTQSSLALIINGPGKTGYYARRDGSSLLEVAYNLTAADFAAGSDWRVTVASFGAGRAEGTLQITYPSGAKVTPFKDNFVVQPNYGSVIHVLALRGAGPISARTAWTGTPANLAFIINGPGQVGYYARQDGPSPLSVGYTVKANDLNQGNTWRVSLTSFSDANAKGSVKITYP